MPMPASAAYLQGQAAITQAKANLNKAQADYDRATDLFEHNAVAKKDVLTAENALAQAKAALEQAQAALEQSDRKLRLLGLKPGAFGQKVTLRAPISGKVLEMSVAAGEYRNDTNTPVMTIADLSTVWVSSDVAESAIRFIQVGERIDVELTAYPGETFHGRVTRIADTVDPQTRTIKVRAEMENSKGKLRPEMYGTIRHTDSMKTLPVVPVGAVLQGDGKTSVWVETARGRFQTVEVKTGERAGDMLPVTERAQGRRRASWWTAQCCCAPSRAPAMIAKLLRFALQPALRDDRALPGPDRHGRVQLPATQGRGLSRYFGYPGGGDHALSRPRRRGSGAAGHGAHRARAERRAQRDRAPLAHHLRTLGGGVDLRLRDRRLFRARRWCSKNCATPRCRTT